MLPVVRSAPAVARRILVYSVRHRGGLAGPVAGRAAPAGSIRWSPRVAGAALLWEAGQLLARAPDRGLTDAALKPMRLFHWSNSYLALVFVAAAVDPLLR